MDVACERLSADVVLTLRIVAALGVLLTALGFCSWVLRRRCPTQYWDYHGRVPWPLKQTKQSYVVDVLREVLDWLAGFGPWEIIRRLCKCCRKDWITDSWVFFVLVVSLLALFLAPPCGLLLALVLWNVLGTVFYELKVVLVDRGRVESYRRLAILTLMNYAQFVFWFAYVYRSVPCAIGANGWCTLQHLYFSLATMSLLGWDEAVLGSFHITGGLGLVLVLMQMVLGLVMTLIIIVHSVGGIRRGERA